MSDIERLRVVMADKTGRLIPYGTTEFLDVNIWDEYAEFHFQKYDTTRRFCILFQVLERKEYGEERSKINERRESFVTKYPGMLKEAIVAKLKKEFESLGGGVSVE